MSSSGDDIDSSNVECPTCGRTNFVSERGMKWHHAQAHGESLAYQMVECDYCGDDVRKHTSEIAKRDHHFCDSSCLGAWYSENQTGENAPNWKGGLSAFECTHCGEEFQKYTSQTEGYNRHFCGSSCMSEWYSKNFTGGGSAAWSGGKSVVECDHCGDEIRKLPCRVDRRGHHFCDQECMGAWRSDRGTVMVACDHCGQGFYKHRSAANRTDHNFCGFSCRDAWVSKNRIGEDHHNWNGGSVPYGEGWTEEKRETVRDRQDRQCASCDVHEEQLSMRLDVHHIVKARSIDDPAKRNALDNLVALCRPCHAEWERFSPLCPEIVQ
jgi:hypothetical protein